MTASFKANGILTLTTDFGHQGPFVATMKGRILSRLPDARIVDVTHEILVYWPAEAGFWLERSYSYFPAGTVHVAVVDPGVGTRRNIILVVRDGHLFLAPDNGLLAPIVNRAGKAQDVAEASLYRLDPQKLGRFALGPASATFHGRDIFAPLAAELAAGRCTPEDIGVAITEITPSWVDDPIDSGKQVTGVVIAIDHFGNLITNIDGSSGAAVSRADRSDRESRISVAADLWGCEAGRVPGAGQFLQRHRDCTGGAECRRGPGAWAGERPVSVVETISSR